MAKGVAIVSALCFLALASIAHGQDMSKVKDDVNNAKVFKVEGNVYCDPCRVEFLTSLSTPLKGVTVELACRDRNSILNVTTQAQTETDADGNYVLNIAGDHEEEICEVAALMSPDQKCNIPFDGADKARVLLTENNGVQGTDRYANPLGFQTEYTDDRCKDVLQEMGMIPEN
ncbi:hypothetical protein ACH5RR_037578 [Cinchona calisaya]|uniref:Uncharacterized protein n=1 Tax=Cinchona calisaya TaxID=153742 RepID=A0ABD2Y6L5_9GENT